MIGELVGWTVLTNKIRERAAINNLVDGTDVVSLGSFLTDENGVPRVASSFYCPLTMAVMKDPVQDREGTVNQYSFEHANSFLLMSDFVMLFYLLDFAISPIIADIFCWPLLLGNSYERAAIMRWLETKDTSPITRNKLKWRHLAPNRALKEAIEFEGECKLYCFISCFMRCFH